MQTRRLSNGFRMVALAASLVLGGCATMTGAADGPGSGSADRQNVELSQLMRLAEKSENAGNHNVAANVYREAARQHPEAVDPQLGLGRTAYAAGRLEDSIQAYRKALERDSDLHEARYGLGKTLLAADRPSAAIAEFDAMIAGGAGGHRPYLAKGVALDLLGRHSDAQDAYRAGLAKAPNSVALRNNLGLSLALSDDNLEAMRVLEELNRDPTAPSRARQNLALVYGLAGRMNQAAETASEDLDPERVERNLAYYRTLSTLRNGQAPTSSSPPPAEVLPESADAASSSEQDRRPSDAPQRLAPNPDESEREPVQLASSPADESLPDDSANAEKVRSGPERHAALETRDRTPNTSSDDDSTKSVATMVQSAVMNGEAVNREGYWAQVASMPSSEHGESEWRRIQGEHPDLVSELPYAVHEGQVEDRGTFYRVRTGPFESAQAPRALCEALQARDQACLVVRE